MENITAITPGKAILFGEHFVVYEYPSIIFAISKKMEITVHSESSQSKINDKKTKNGIKIKISSNLGFNTQVIDNNIISSNSSFSLNPNIITNLNKILQFLIYDNKDQFDGIVDEGLVIDIHSEIPIGGGLGSSSALCVSLTGAIYAILNKKLDKGLLCKKSIDLERIINPNTSGVDCNVCTFGGFGIYEKLSGFRRLEIDTSDLQFLIIDSGINHNTFEMVNKVKKIKENDIDFFEKLCNDYEKILELSLKLLKKKDLEGLGALMDKNHFLLKNLSLSNPVVDKVVEICKHNGSYGTKITGAGGGGCILSLINMDEKFLLKRLIKDLNELKLRYYFVNSDDYGFRIEEKDLY